MGTNWSKKTASDLEPWKTNKQIEIRYSDRFEENFLKHKNKFKS